MRLSIEVIVGGIAMLLVAAGDARAQQQQQQQQPSVVTSSPPSPTPATSPAPAQTPVGTTTTTSVIAPTTSPASADLPAPETTTSPINRPLMVSGLVFLGGTYAASAIDAAASTRASDNNNLYYPIVGPWMDYADRGGCPAAGSCAGETGNKALLILDGVGQGLGALAIITSLFLPEKSTRHWYLIGDGGIHAAPARVGTGYGLGSGGTF